LTAFQHLPKNYVLVFTGVDHREQDWLKWKDVIEKAGLEYRVIILGRMPYSTVLDYAAACDIGVLLYPDDGVGNFYQAPGRLSEYLACGMPVVASSFPGLELLILKYGLGAVADPGSPVDIARSIRQITEMRPNKFMQMSDRLQRVARGPLAFDEQATTIDKIVRQRVKRFSST
jgi:glycosyltransferase involved in cell wall biosynthesis